ncbi:hypothetical protein B0H10DRAFT_1942656 [Mycena sp. CBHHK59/15]|nr:hypothetical protein B0H10DRAFT_1942656 [Mycena sp. CBHHK59/15]
MSMTEHTTLQKAAEVDPSPRATHTPENQMIPVATLLIEGVDVATANKLTSEMLSIAADASAWTEQAEELLEYADKPAQMFNAYRLANIDVPVNPSDTDQASRGLGSTSDIDLARSIRELVNDFLEGLKVGEDEAASSESEPIRLSSAQSTEVRPKPTTADHTGSTKIVEKGAYSEEAASSGLYVWPGCGGQSELDAGLSKWMTSGMGVVLWGLYLYRRIQRLRGLHVVQGLGTNEGVQLAQSFS